MTFHYWNNKNSRRERADARPPENRFKLFFWLIRHHFWDLLVLNFFVLLHSLGVVTVFPAVSTMNRVIFNMIEDKPQMLWQEYRSIFKRDCKQSILLGLPLIPMAAILLFAGGFFRPEFMADWLSVVCFILFCCLVVASCYLFSMVSYVQLDTMQYYKNAMLLTALCFWRNLPAFAFSLLFLFAVRILAPASVPIAFFLTIPTVGFVMSYCTYEGIRKHIVKV